MDFPVRHLYSVPFLPHPHIDPHLRTNRGRGIDDIFEFQPSQTVPDNRPHTSWQAFPHDSGTVNPRSGENLSWHDYLPHLYSEHTLPHQMHGMGYDTEMQAPQRARSLSIGNGSRLGPMTRFRNWSEKKFAELEPVRAKAWHSQHQDWYDLVDDRKAALEQSHRVLPVRLRQFARELDKLDSTSAKATSTSQQREIAAHNALYAQQKVINALNLMASRETRLSQFTNTKDAYLLATEATEAQRIRAALDSQAELERARHWQLHQRQETERDIANQKALLEVKIQIFEDIGDWRRYYKAFKEVEIMRLQEKREMAKLQLEHQDNQLQQELENLKFDRECQFDYTRATDKRAQAFAKHQDETQKITLEFEIERLKTKQKLEEEAQKTKAEIAALQKQFDDLSKKKPDEKK